MINEGNCMKVRANCKINLALNVEGLLPNGYHSVKMIMQEISLYDEISLNFGQTGVSLSCSNSVIPTNNENIACRAAELFYEETGIKGGVHIHIDKHIPIEAGIGGGSADGAAVLKAMNEYYSSDLPKEKLIELAARLGADVPFFIIGKTALCCGIGEIMTPVDSKIKADVLIVKPPVGISTPWAYKRLDEMGFTAVDVDRVRLALEAGDMNELCSSIGNVFEETAVEAAPEIFEIKNNLLSYGARCSMMSGSGTAVFGIFEDNDALCSAYDYFKNVYPETYKAEMI